jgi:hypothetical protein
VTLGSAGTLQNSQCSVNLGSSSASGSGTNLTMNLAITFTTAFAGTQSINMRADDNGGQTSGWLTMGTWTVTNPNNQPPSVVSVTPNSGSGLGPQTFGFVYSDPNGYTDLRELRAQFSSTGAASNSCYLKYARNANSLYMLNDAGTSYLGPVTLGVAGTLQNSQCSVNAANSSASGSGTSLSMNLAITFTATFAGKATISMYAVDNLGLTSGWQNMGTWTPNPPAVPSAVSVTPSSGSGTSQTFTYLFSDASGYQHISNAYSMISASQSWAGSCLPMYVPASHSLYLAMDGGTGWLGPLTIGQAGTLQNSQCTLNAGASSASGSGTNLTVNLAISFSSSFVGLKNQYMRADDAANNLSSGWQNRGTWFTAPAPTPSAVSMTPSSGSGTSQTFSYLYSDAAGYQHISNAYSMISASPSWGGSCLPMYVPASHSLYLATDAGTSWLGPLTIGQDGTLQNTQCTLNAGASSASGSGTNLTVNLAISFQPTFTGLKNQYMRADDAANSLSSGWQNRGTWTTGP